METVGGEQASERRTPLLSDPARRFQGIRTGEPAVNGRGPRLRVAQARSVAHQENERADVFTWSPIPVTHQDRIYHQPRLTFAEQQIPDGLRHQLPPGETDEDGNGIDGFTDERDGVGNGNGVVGLHEVVVALFLDGYLQGRGELAAVIEQIHMEEQKGPSDAVVPHNLAAFSPASFRRRTCDGNQVNLLASQLRTHSPALDIGEVAVRNAHLDRSE